MTLERCRRKVTDHLVLRPGLFARLLHTRSWKEWGRKHAAMLDAATQAEDKAEAASASLSQAANARTIAADEVRKQGAEITALRSRAAETNRFLDGQRAELGDRIVDTTFFGKSHEASNLSSPWLPNTVHEKREALFIAAMQVHRAFIDASAAKVMHNLSNMMTVFSSGPFKDEARRNLLGELWSTLFMVVPVLSTTFASVERMMGGLPAGSIGWLLVDEAGQAVPQAAVGAMTRSRRTVVVGDPLQIPPVVSLPDRLTDEICRFFQVDTTLWASPEASVQTLADRASAHQAAFRSDKGPRHVGIPLLVHRRCQEPMFGISNRIAYDGQMVHAASSRNPGLVGETLGPSAWFDIAGEADTKWCPAEGDLAVDLLRRVQAAGAKEPDIFIISPFKIVADEMRRRLQQERALFSAMRTDADQWAKDRVGTVHTFQGREAETVLIVLGAPKTGQNGARNWAGGTPNLLNVAVSRAKQNLYVIGSYRAWAGVGHARELAAIERREISNSTL